MKYQYLKLYKFKCTHAQSKRGVCECMLVCLCATAPQVLVCFYHCLSDCLRVHPVSVVLSHTHFFPSSLSHTGSTGTARSCFCFFLVWLFLCLCFVVVVVAATVCFLCILLFILCVFFVVGCLSSILSPSLFALPSYLC